MDSQIGTEWHDRTDVHAVPHWLQDWITEEFKTLDGSLRYVADLVFIQNLLMCRSVYWLSDLIRPLNSADPIRISACAMRLAMHIETQLNFKLHPEPLSKCELSCPYGMDWITPKFLQMPVMSCLIPLKVHIPALTAYGGCPSMRVTSRWCLHCLTMGMGKVCSVTNIGIKREYQLLNLHNYEL